MQTNTDFLLSIAGFLLLGLLTEILGKKTFLPRVTMLLILGVVIGESFLDLIPPIFTHRFELISEIALLMIGFLLGGKLTRDFLLQSGMQSLIISLVAALVTFVIVLTGLWLAGLQLQIAIMLGAIAAATAPAATVDLIIESGYQGRFSDLLLSIVALDDIWALIIFSLSISLVQAINGGGADVSLLMSLKEIGGAVLIGIIVGVPAAYLTGRLKSGRPILTEALAVVFLCGGLALSIGASFLIASMIAGAVIVNLAKHHERPFCEIENIEWPIMIIFFVLAGASLEINALDQIGWIGLIYILLRIVGKLAGTWFGASLTKSEPVVKQWMGIALLPQAGVAIGIALVASNTYPQYRQIILPVVISSTILFEIAGPVLARFALRKASQLQ